MKLLLCMDLREEHTEKEEEKRFAFIWILIKKNLYEISYYAAGGKEFSSYPSQYFNTDINMMDEYKKLKANSDCNLAKEIKFIRSNNNCEPIIVY